MGLLPMSYTISPFVFSFETRSHYVAKARLKFAILPRLPGSWDCRCAPPYLASKHCYQPEENKMSKEWPEDHRVSLPGWPPDQRTGEEMHPGLKGETRIAQWQGTLGSVPSVGRVGRGEPAWSTSGGRNLETASQYYSSRHRGKGAQRQRGV